MTPNDAPRVLRMSSVLRQWSHCSILSVSALHLSTTSSSAGQRGQASCLLPGSIPSR